MRMLPCACFFFFNDTATTEIYTLSLHDALPISRCCARRLAASASTIHGARTTFAMPLATCVARSEEHTSELQSQSNLVCRLLLEKKNRTTSPSISAERARTQTPWL